MRNKRLLTISFFVLTGLFCLLMTNLFLLRFKAGDIYPPYSSLRSDPLGTKALFIAMKKLDAVIVRRNFQPVRLLESTDKTCFFFMGVPTGKHHVISREEYNRIKQLIDKGNRLVIALRPVNPESFSRSSPEKEKQTGTNSEKQENNDLEKKIDLFKAMGLTIRHEKSKPAPVSARPVFQPLPPGSTKPVFWPMTLWFETGPTWDPILSIGGKPVIIEKKWANGSVVMLADSYLFSNESLKKHDHSQILAWLPKDKNHIVFDEYHLGIRQQAGVSTLIRKYDLFGILGLIAIFMILFVWKNTTSLVPADDQHSMRPLPGDEGEHPVPGMVYLLRQHIHKSDLIGQCIAAWKNTFVKNNKASKKFSKRYEQINSPPEPGTGKHDPVKEYIRICNMLLRKEEK